MALRYVPEPSLDFTEKIELERLRAEVNSLRAANDELRRQIPRNQHTYSGQSNTHFPASYFDRHTSRPVYSAQPTYSSTQTSPQAYSPDEQPRSGPEHTSQFSEATSVDLSTFSISDGITPNTDDFDLTEWIHNFENAEVAIQALPNSQSPAPILPEYETSHRPLEFLPNECLEVSMSSMPISRSQTAVLPDYTTSHGISYKPLQSLTNEYFEAPLASIPNQQSPAPFDEGFATSLMPSEPLNDTQRPRLDSTSREKSFSGYMNSSTGEEVATPFHSQRSFPAVGAPGFKQWQDKVYQNEGAMDQTCSKSGSRKKISTADWNNIREIFISLYQVHQLKDVMQIMRTKYGFDASIKQYKSRITEWIRAGYMAPKKYKKSEMEAMVRLQNERQAQEGKQSAFRYLGWEVDPEKIERFRSRYQSTLQECIDPPPELSEFLSCHTPPSSGTLTFESSWRCPLSPSSASPKHPFLQHTMSMANLHEEPGWHFPRSPPSPSTPMMSATSRSATPLNSNNPFFNMAKMSNLPSSTGSSLSGSMQSIIRQGTNRCATPVAPQPVRPIVISTNLTPRSPSTSATSDLLGGNDFSSLAPSFPQFATRNPYRNNGAMASPPQSDTSLNIITPRDTDMGEAFASYHETQMTHPNSTLSHTQEKVWPEDNFSLTPNSVPRMASLIKAPKIPKERDEHSHVDSRPIDQVNNGRLHSRPHLRFLDISALIKKQLYSRMATGYWGTTVSSGSAATNQKLDDEANWFNAVVTDCSSWIDQSYVLTLVHRLKTLIFQHARNEDLYSHALSSGREAADTSAVQNNAFSALQRLLESLYQWLMRIRQYNSRSIAQRYGSFWESWQRRTGAHAASELPEVLRSVWPWSNRPPLTVILFVHHMFSQVLPSDSQDISQEEISHMIDEMDLGLLQGFIHGQHTDVLERIGPTMLSASPFLLEDMSSF